MSIRERREIVTLAAKGGPGVLVTLVRATGSSYRRPGAHLLLQQDGAFAGTISGGCLEADLLRTAAWRVRDGAVLRRYDTGFDDTAEIPFGLGCGGLVDLLLEPSDSPEAAALFEGMQATLHGELRQCVTRLPTPEMPLARAVLDGRGDVLFCSEGLETEEVVRLRSVALGRTATAAGELFVEALEPAQRLVIFGAGEDARSLVRIAAEMGWAIAVADGRPQHIRPERFPEAHEVRVVQRAAEMRLTASDAIVLMTHSFEQDLRLLTELLTTLPRYLGLLGARQRSALLLHRAAAAAGLPFADALSRTHAPIGLHLGGDGPETIALAIAAEIQAVLQGATIASRHMAVEEARMLLDRFEASAARVCGLQEIPLHALAAEPSPEEAIA